MGAQASYTPPDCSNRAAYPCPAGSPTSDHIARVNSPTAAARNANTANVVNMTSPVNKPNLPNAVNNADTANLRKMSNIQHGRHREQGQLGPTRRPRRAVTAGRPLSAL
jgi:hypothetical protein